MENNTLLEELFDKKKLKVIRFFLLSKGKRYYLQEISKKTKIPLATVFRIVNKLKSLKLVEELRIKRFKLYRCAENKNIEFLESFMKESKKILNEFVDFAKDLKNVEEIILYGKESEDKANILLIGKNIDPNKIKQISNEFKEKYDYNLTTLTLEKEQFEQMSAMGLYSSNKETLWEKR